MPDDENDDLPAKMENVRSRTRELTTGSNSFARAITSAFAQGATGAKSFDSVLKSLALRLSTLSLNLALKPLTGLLGGGLDQLFKGIGSAFTGTPTPNAKGGILSSPTYFPLAGNRLGVAGEAGPEAIIPLSRGPDGRLGVALTASGEVGVAGSLAPSWVRRSASVRRPTGS